MAKSQLMFEWAQASNHEAIPACPELGVKVDPSHQQNSDPEICPDSQSGSVDAGDSVPADSCHSPNVSLAPGSDAVDDAQISNDDEPYGPGHPWHYLAEGDNATPVSPDEIAPAAFATDSLGIKIPKNARKREEFLRRMLADQREQLERDIQFYRDVVSRGVEVLSRYDREIAYGRDDRMAVACTIALKYNHITFGKARVAWLEKATAAELGF